MNNNQPANIRALYNSFTDAQNLTEKDFSPKQLNALRNLYLTNGTGPTTYSDYPDQYARPWEKGAKLIGDSYNNPYFDIMTTLGKFNTYKDNNGNVIIKDRYDFGKSGKINWKENVPYQAIHKIAEKYSKPFDVVINLGNPNSWGDTYVKVGPNVGKSNQLKAEEEILNRMMRGK